MKSVIICFILGALSALAVANALYHPDLSFNLGWAALLGSAIGMGILGAVLAAFIFVTCLISRFPLVVCSVFSLMVFEGGLFYSWKMAGYGVAHTSNSSLYRAR
jgi:hypothetical protein